LYVPIKHYCPDCLGNGKQDKWSDWLTLNDGLIRKIAQAIYEERRFEDMPVLADALQEAGCENADILNHCRGWGLVQASPGKGMVWRRGVATTHVRGCWVIDLLLGKE